MIIKKLINEKNDLYDSGIKYKDVYAFSFIIKFSKYDNIKVYNKLKKK